MAKKFDLAALMGEAVSKSDTGEMRVEQIPLAEIEENENNSYAQTGIDELAESIKVIGLQQPLVVRRKTEGGYLLLCRTPPPERTGAARPQDRALHCA